MDSRAGEGYKQMCPGLKRRFLFLMALKYYLLQFMFYYPDMFLACLLIKETYSTFEATLLLEKSLMFVSP